MSDAGKAVFLSYASQDAEAAKRICEALRAAGVEVWFDQSELVGGDAWDQKIRKQIKECALFIPILSQTTQGRREAYFRLEWKLADERTHLMARGTPFLLPVTIDGTNDREALVPDSFLAVQWTKLPNGETPPAFGARVKKLLEGEKVGGALRPDSAETSGHKAPPTQETIRWLKPVLAFVVIGVAALAYTLLSRRAPETAIMPPVVPAPSPAAVASPVSPARELVAKARELALALDATREDFALAEEYCQRALKLDPDDGEVWAIYSQVHSAFGYRGWDTSPERREQTRTTAERAVRLAPQSANARLAQAGAWATFGINRDEREKLLREILRDEPDNQEVLRFLAITVLPKPGGLEEALALNERSAALPGGDPLALFNSARYLWTAGQPAKGYEVLQRSLAQRKFTSALVLKMGMELTWRGDLAAAEATLRQIPPSTLQEDRANYSAGLLRYYQRDAAGALEAWGAFPRDFYVDFIFDGPKGLLLGLAHELDHRDVAARTEWLAALREVEKKIAATPNRAGPYYSQAYLLACLGEKAAAGEALRTHEELAKIKYLPGQGMTVPLAKVYARLGRFDEIFAHLPGTPAVLRISPDFDTLRADPRYEKFQGAAQPASESPGPEPRSQTQKAGRSDRPLVDQKSVAVLAFANLSDDKANEYFSDGISEELLNVLAKVPGLKVTARTSSFHFKGKDVPVPEIAQKLGVAYVVEGSVRKSGDKVRITAQLIKAADGFHVWSDTFTRDLKDIFAVQDEIAGLIAQQLQLKLGATATAAFSDTSPEAYQLFLEARQAVGRRTREDYNRAEELLRQSIALSPRFARAHAGLGLVWVLRTEQVEADMSFGVRDGTDARRFEAKIREALDLDPNSAEAYAALGLLLWNRWKFDEGAAALEHAIQLNPNYASACQWLGRLRVNQGRMDEGLAMMRRATELDPLAPRILDNYARPLLFAGRPDEALVMADRALQLQPGAIQAVAMKALAHADLGQFEAAQAALRRLPDESLVAYIRPLVLAQCGQAGELERMLATDALPGFFGRFTALVVLGRTTEALDLLNADDLNSNRLDFLLFHPAYDRVRSEPKFRQMLETTHLTDFHAKAQAWRAAHPPAKAPKQ